MTHTIEGNVHNMHVSPGRPNVCALIVHSAFHSGQFNAPTDHVTIDGAKVTRIGEVADFLATREFTAVLAKGVPEGGAVLGVYPAASFDLVTVEAPIQSITRDEAPG